MGRVAGPYGVHGWMKIAPFTGSPRALLDYATWWLSPPGVERPTAHRLRAGRLHGGGVVAELEGITTREAAAAWRGAEVLVPRDAMPAAGANEIYWSDLAGCAVVNRRGEILGSVAEVGAHGAHPILRVVAEEGGAERLIPFVPAVVDGVDLEARRIDVDWGKDY